MYDSPSSGGYALFALVGGPILLGRGLRRLKEKRLIQNTPVSKVRSAAVGLIELAGVARRRKEMNSPLSTVKCCCWNCEVQELRSDGRKAYWHPISKLGTIDLFYLDDSTGRVLINPMGAQLHVMSYTFHLNPETRAFLEPALIQCGINDKSLFGGTREIRIIERVIPEGERLFVMGQLVPMGEHLEDRQARFNERLRAIKADPVKMAEADINHDGAIDAEEWDAFRHKQEEEFLKEEIARQANLPAEDLMLVKAPAKGPFVISTESEKELIDSYKWTAPTAVSGGIGISGIGVWLGLANGWQPYHLVGLVVLGLVVGTFIKRFNFRIGESA